MGTLLAVLAYLSALGQPAGVDAPREGVKRFAPGIQINWPNLTVELEAEIALREGPLEFLACSPQSKEHESILVVLAKPSLIFQSLGLIGLTPGSPTRYIEKEDRWEPARGDGLDLRIRCPDREKDKTVKPEEWVLSAKGDGSAAAPELRWVFAGSLTSKDGRFAADLEGTVAAVVDFESNLIALAASHSADNEQLWLIANKERIPPRGTHCQLLVRADRRPPLRVSLRADESMRWQDRAVELDELFEKLKAAGDDSRPIGLQICQEPGTSDETREKLQKALEQAGFSGPIEVFQPPCGEPGNAPRPD